MKPNNAPKGETVSFYKDVLVNALLDLADTNCVSKQESRRDAQEIERRVACEGLPFLVNSLPLLGKALDRALSNDDTVFVIDGFEKTQNSVLPKFLGCYWVRIFDDHGRVLPDACPQSVAAIRQLVYLLYKLEIPYTDDQVDRVVNAFIDAESALPATRDALWAACSEEERRILDDASLLISDIFCGFDPHDIRPKHGPGAVATGELNHQKHVFRRLYAQIERVYPFTEYFCFSLSHVADSWPKWQAPGPRGLQVLESGTAKVVLVPKDSRGPRLISCEPLEYQWIQQGLGNSIREHIERCALTRGHVNFTDQEVNRSLALAGSLGAPWVTLDMKEASDRVSVGLVEYLFQHVPRLLEALMATRTTATKLPSGDVVRLKKFAPMGSNLCFPIESIVFFVLAVSCIMQRLSEPSTGYKGVNPLPRVLRRRKLLARAISQVYVYGDDIVCNNQDYRLLYTHFPSFGLMFNSDKCCTSGSFRESCGMDAFKGVPVQPLRLKRMWSVHCKQDALTLASYVAFSNAAYARELYRTSEFITQKVEGQTGPLPVKPAGGSSNCLRDPNEGTSALVWIRYGVTVTRQPRNVKTRFNKHVHRFEVRCLLPTSHVICVASDDWCMVLRRFTSPTRRRDPGIFPLAHRVSLKWAWIPLAD